MKRLGVFLALLLHGSGDKLHPNRAGYAAMADSIDLKLITGRWPHWECPVPSSATPRGTDLV